MTRGERIKERRKALGYTAETLGEMIGRDRATVYKYECGALKKMDIEILKRLAEALQTTIEYLNEDEPDVLEEGDDFPEETEIRIDIRIRRRK